MDNASLHAHSLWLSAVEFVLVATTLVLLALCSLLIALAVRLHPLNLSFLLQILQ